MAEPGPHLLLAPDADPLQQFAVGELGDYLFRLFGVEAAMRATAAHIRDDSDRATLAAYYHFFVRQVREQAAALLAGEVGATARRDPM